MPGVDLRREADADRDAVLLLDQPPAAQDVVPRRRGDADAVPQVLAVVDRIRHVAVREAEVLLRLRVVGAADREVDRLAELALALLVDLAVVDDVVLEDGRRTREHEQVVALLRGRLGLGTQWQRLERDPVDDHLDVVGLAPLLHVGVVEPVVVAQHEVVPLHDAQRARRARRAAGGRTVRGSRPHLVAAALRRNSRRPRSTGAAGAWVGVSVIAIASVAGRPARPWSGRDGSRFHHPPAHSDLLEADQACAQSDVAVDGPGGAAGAPPAADRSRSGIRRLAPRSA